MEQANFTKYIYIFGYKFTIESYYNYDVDRWMITVSLGKLQKTYHDHTLERHDAEEASFGYFLHEYCQGGIFWYEPDEENKENLLAEQIG